MRLYITRHGQTDWNTENRIQGRTDIPLNALGVEQAEILRDELADMHFDRFFLPRFRALFRRHRLLLLSII